MVGSLPFINSMLSARRGTNTRQNNINVNENTIFGNFNGGAAAYGSSNSLNESNNISNSQERLSYKQTKTIAADLN